MKKYYQAYEERYKTSHENGLLWLSDINTPEVENWMTEYSIPQTDYICELGCGEGRDVIHLAKNGYKLTGIDISPSAINKMQELSNELGLEVNGLVLDATESDDFSDNYKWIYSVAVLHMLVEDEHRHKYLSTLRKLLTDDGRAMLMAMGDGESERSSDTTEAFNLVERTHMQTQKKMMVASTTFRCVNWDKLTHELQSAGLEIEHKFISQNELYGDCMVVYLKKH